MCAAVLCNIFQWLLHYFDLYFFTVLLLSSGRFCSLRVVGLRREVAARWLHIHAGYIAPFPLHRAQALASGAVSFCYHGEPTRRNDAHGHRQGWAHAVPKARSCT